MPIEKSLRSLYVHNKQHFVFKETRQEQTDQQILRDVHDGHVYGNITLFGQEKAFEIILYMDSFEIVNPLGAAKIKHKLVGVGIYCLLRPIQLSTYLPPTHRRRIMHSMFGELFQEPNNCQELPIRGKIMDYGNQRGSLWIYLSGDPDLTERPWGTRASGSPSGHQKAFNDRRIRFLSQSRRFQTRGTALARLRL